jgi:predicted phosphoribosyltransferase
MRYILFEDREDAGQQLAEAVAALGLDPGSTVVLALPRGGVPVAHEIALKLGCPLDLVLVRKIGAPHQPELALGAVVEGPANEVVLNDEVVRALRVPAVVIERIIARELKTIAKRRALYPRPGGVGDLAGKTVILVDDGIATGASMRAALHGVRRKGPARVIVASPVATPETRDELAREADEVIVLAAPEDFGAIGLFYRDFTQVEDAEVARLLRSAEARRPG